MNSPFRGTRHVSRPNTPAGWLRTPETLGDPGCIGPLRTAPEARQEGSPARHGVPVGPGVGAMGWVQRWERLTNDDERRRRGTSIFGKAIELCRPSGARYRLYRLPRAYALGYLLNAPNGAGLFGAGDVDRLGLAIKTGSLWRRPQFARAGRGIPLGRSKPLLARQQGPRR